MSSKTEVNQNQHKNQSQNQLKADQNQQCTQDMQKQLPKMDSKPALVDLHSHTYLCKHAELVEPQAFLYIAKQMGFTRIAFCDHCFFPGDDYDFIHRMSIIEVPLFNQLYEKQCQVAAELGMQKPFRNMETDWAVLDHQRTIDLIKGHFDDYDGVIGSIHFNDWTEMQAMRQLNVEQFLDLYRREFLFMANSGLVQGVAHFDFFKCYNWKINQMIQTEQGLKKIDDWIVETISMVTNPNFAVEINTSAENKDPDMFETFVDRYVIKRLGELGVKMYLGSDSHFLSQIGYHFDMFLEYLLSVGVDTLYYFEKKQLVGYSVSDALKLYKKMDQAYCDQLSTQFKLK